MRLPCSRPKRQREAPTRALLILESIAAAAAGDRARMCAVDADRGLSACLEGLEQEGLGDEGGARQEAGQVGGSCRARDGGNIGVCQPLQEQLQEGGAALLRTLHPHTCSVNLHASAVVQLVMISVADTRPSHVALRLPASAT